MCRHGCIVGEPTDLLYPLWTAPHSFREQARRPKELLVGSTCADGFGVGWYADEETTAARYANALPLWADGNVPGFLGHVRTRQAVFAVRDATVEGTNTEPNCHPFKDGEFLFSQNGFLQHFHTEWKDMLRAEWIAADRLRRIRGDTDSEHLFQAILTRFDQEPSGPDALVRATLHVLRQVKEYSAQTGLWTQLNFLLSDGRVTIATRDTTKEQANSLYLHRDHPEFPGSILVCSEPLDAQEGWEPVEQGQLLVLSPGAPVIRMRTTA